MGIWVFIGGLERHPWLIAPTAPLAPFAQTDTYKKQKRADQFADTTGLTTIKRMTGHPEAVRDYE
jgi:hypothetical protein